MTRCARGAILSRMATVPNTSTYPTSGLKARLYLTGETEYAQYRPVFDASKVHSLCRLVAAGLGNTVPAQRLASELRKGSK